MNESQLMIELEEAKAENRYLRHQLNNTFHEALRLRHAMEQIYGAAHMTLHVINTGATDEKRNG
jgi:hypothetical protein